MAATGCEKDVNGNGQGNQSSVSDAATAAFEERYPEAKNVRWSVNGQYAVANFSLTSDSGNENNAWFENNNGVWEMTETNIQFETLPEAVRTGFQNSKYGDATVWTRTGKCDKLERRDVMVTDGQSVVVYVIGVTSQTADGFTNNVDLYFSEDGILVNEISGAPDNNYQDQLPQEPTASIEQYLQENIIARGGRVIEIDRENGGTEIEAILDNRKIELYFDASENWVYTKTDYYRQDLNNGQIPANILETLRASEYYTSDNAVEDIEKVEAKTAEGNGTWWVFEIESRWDDMEVYIDDSGIIPSRPTIDMGDTGGIQTGSDIETFINEKYAGARIIERDYDDGFLEVEIFHDNVAKELLFNGSNEWLRTTWEIRINALPQAVTDAITAAGYRIDDDEANVVETPSATYYEIEVADGGREMQLHIDANGQILRTEYDD